MDLSRWVTTTDLISIVLVLVFTIVARFLLVRLVKSLTKKALERARNRREKGHTKAERLLESMAMGSQERYEQRTATLGSISASLISATLWLIAVLTILAIVHVPLGPLLTSAGVGGIALAFGAQSLVKDFLSGMFMLMEDQYGVGDMIDTGEVKGTVEEVGLRVTRLRDLSGTVWYVRNGEILRLGNQSQGWSTAIIDVPVSHEEDPGRVIMVLEEVAVEAENAEELSDVLLERPTVVGVNALSATTMTIRLIGKTLPNQHWKVQRWLLEHSLSALAKAGVRSPSPLGIFPT
jgi:moderate conductance mechanosensitive channel